MSHYKLKKEARQFFEEKFHKEVKPLKYWESLIISERLLDEVDKVYIEYGKKIGDRTELCGWSSNDGYPVARFEFTVYVNDMSDTNYENVKVSDVMDEIQAVLNKYFKK